MNLQTLNFKIVVFTAAIFIVSCKPQADKKIENNESFIETDTIVKTQPNDFNDDCPPNKPFTSIAELNKLPNIQTNEKKFPKLFDSLKTIGDFRLDITLDSIDNINTFEKLSELDNMKSIDISLSASPNRPHRSGINLLKQVKRLVIQGAGSTHLIQLANLDSLIHLEIHWYNMDSEIPEEAFYQRNLRSINLYATHAHNLPQSLSKLCLLEEFAATKSSFNNLPFDYKSNKNLKRVWLMTSYYNGESFKELEKFESLDTLYIDRDMLGKVDSNYLERKTVEGFYDDNFYKIY